MSQNFLHTRTIIAPRDLDIPFFINANQIINMATCRILVMASGNGSNFQALADAVAAGQSGNSGIPHSSIVRLIVNSGKAFARERARNMGIEEENFNLITHGFKAMGEKDPVKIQEARGNYDAALAQKILEHKPDLVVLAGW